MKRATISKLSTLTLSAFIIVAGNSASVIAEENLNNETRLELAFAPEPSDNTLLDRFNQFDDAEEYIDEHEYVDTWLGMPIISEDGKDIGYIEDAFIDKDGNLEKILVSINDTNTAVYVDAKYVEYKSLAVLISLPAQTIASLEVEEGFQFVQ